MITTGFISIHDLQKIPSIIPPKGLQQDDLTYLVKF